MTSFDWGKHFETGIRDVDAQHHGLVDLINAFGAQLSQNRIDAKQVDETVEHLAVYAGQHFRDEEALMHECGLDRRHVAAHVDAHQAFLQEVNEMRSHLTEDDAASARYLLDFLTHWLAYHILGVDQNMARQIDAIRQGRSAGEAFDDGERERDAATEPLLAALNGLFRQVSARNRELLRLNQSLEQKVAERTQALNEANKHLEQIALTDALTGLPNRRHAMQQLEKLWRETTPRRQALSCMMVDADHFKDINDRYGHDAGDDVLRQLASCLSGAVRNDDLVCRLGGDEFFVICPETDIQGVVQAGLKVHRAVNGLSVAAGDGCWQGSVSVGVAARRPHMQGFEELIKLADEGVYLAKRDGKNCVRAVD